MKNQMKIRCKKEIFNRMITRAGPFLDELAINIDENGMNTRLVDAAHVALYDCIIDRKAFESFELTNNITLGIDLKKIDIPLSLVDEDMELEYLEYEAKLRINNYKHSLADISKAEPIKPMNMNPPIEIKTDKTEHIKKLASVAKRISEVLEFYVGEDKMMYVRAKGKTDEFAEPLGMVTQIRTAKYPISAQYSVDILIKILKDLKKDISISFNSDEPMTIIEEIENEKHTFMLAPRIDNE